MTYIIIITLGFICSTAWIDSGHFKNHQYIGSHLSRNFQRLFFFIGLGLYSIPYAFAGACLFWVLFDSILSLLRGLNIFYIGEEAESDKWGEKYPVMFWCSKIVALMVSIIIFVKY